MKNLLVLLICYCCFGAVNGQDKGTRGQEFWLAYMENLSLAFNGNPKFAVYVSSKQSGKAVITVPGTGLTFSFNYFEDTLTEFEFPLGIFYAEGSEKIENFGFRINTSTPSSVFALHNRINFSEATILYPIDVLADDYVVTAAEDFDKALNSPSCFVIVATEDNTDIEIIPTATTKALRPANQVFKVNLNKGQSYQVQAYKDLTGTRIRAANGSKIAVFAGATHADLQCKSADNHLYDQLLPVHYAAKTYPLIPFKNQGNSIFKVVAIEDNTEISINDKYISTLAANEAIELLYDSPKILSSNKDVMVTQFNPSQSCTASKLGDPTMLLLHGIDYRVRSAQFKNMGKFMPIAPGAPSKQHVTLFTEAENAQAIYLNAEDISSQFELFPNYPKYKFARLDLSIGNTALQANNGVLAYAYGFNDYDAYSYSLGFDKNIKTAVETSLSKFDIFPNPSDGYVNIHRTKATEQILNIYTVQGIPIHSQSISSIETRIDLKHLNAGIYLVQVGNNFKKIVLF